MGTLANSVHPGEMPHNVAFHQGLHFFSQEKEINTVTIILDIITWHLSMYTMTQHHTLWEFP